MVIPSTNRPSLYDHLLNVPVIPTEQEAFQPFYQVVVRALRGDTMGQVAVRIVAPYRRVPRVAFSDAHKESIERLSLLKRANAVL